MFDLLNLIVAVVGGVLAVLAWRKSRLADEANERYQDVQKQLVELQLIAAQKANIVLQFQMDYITTYHPSYTGEKTTIPKTQRVRRLLIRNTGNVEAYDITLAFEPDTSECRLPRDLEEMESISVLAPGIEIPIRISLAVDDCLQLKGSWSWKNPNGTTEERKSILIIPTN